MVKTYSISKGQHSKNEQEIPADQNFRVKVLLLNSSLVLRDGLNSLMNKASSVKRRYGVLALPII